MWARTACTSSGVMSVTPWCEAACTATWEKMPSSSGALKCALQPGMTSPQEKVFMAGSLSWMGGRGWGKAGLPGGPDSGGEVLDAQQAEDGAGRVGAEDRLEAVGRGPGEGAHQRLGDVGRRVHAERDRSAVDLARARVTEQEGQRLVVVAHEHQGRDRVRTRRPRVRRLHLGHPPEQAGHAVGGPRPGGLGAHQPGHLGGQRAEVRAGPAEQPALAQGDAEPHERGQLRRGLQAFGEHPGVDPAGELAEHLGQRHPHRIGVGVADQRPVQLDDLRSQGGQLLQAGVAAACVVQGDEGAAAAQLVGLPAQCGQVVHRGVLGQLHDDPVQVGSGRQRVLDGSRPEQMGADVHGQEGVGRQRRDGGQRLVDGEGLEFGGDAGLGGRGEPGVGAGDTGEAGQGLVPRDGGRREVDDGLEDQGQVLGIGQQRAAVRQTGRSRREHVLPIGSPARPLDPSSGRSPGWGRNHPDTGTRPPEARSSPAVRACQHGCNECSSGTERKARPVADTALPPEGDPLADPPGSAAVRRLLVEGPGPAAFDRLSGLAARLVGAGHAKVTLFTDQDTVVGGYGLPAGVVGGPALLTGALSAIVVRQGAPLHVSDAGADPRLAEPPAVPSGQVRASLGAPLVAASGHVVGVLAVYDPEPRSWSDDSARLLEQLSASVVAELELSAAQSAVGRSVARLDVALEAGSVGIWERDLRTGTVYWDERCAAIFGYDGAVEMPSSDDLMLKHIHPDDHEAVREPLRRAMATGAEYSVESRIIRADGALRWTVSRGRVVKDSRGEPVRLLGTTVDVTEAREQAQHRFAAVQRAAAIVEVAAELANATRLDQLADIAQRGGRALGAQSSALAVFDPDGVLRLHMTHWLVDAARAGADVELPASGVEIELDDLLPTQYAARHGRRVLLADPEEASARFPKMAEMTEILGVHAVAALPLRVEGRVFGSFVVVWETEHPFAGDDLEILEALTAQIALSVSRLQADAERAAAEQAMADANRRLQLLADAGQVLSGTLDITRQIEQLADLVVPALGEWCWLVVNDEQGRLHEMACAHRDPARQPEVEEYVRSMVDVMTDDAGARIVTRTGRPLVLPVIGRERIDRALGDAAAREALVRLGVRSGVVVPLVARGQTLGALGLFTGDERGPHTQAEIDTAVEIGRRAGLALHHARLFGQQRALADALQRSMLTEPPETDGCEIVVRYVPAAAGAEVGGDWYDAFPQRGGNTVLAIGDVVGHDTRAAAAMGQVRGLLRGISYSSGGTPAEVLTELDRAVLGLNLDTMATALVARLEAGGAAAGGPVRLRWASAGHPPLVLITPDGDVSVLDASAPDLLLGVFPDSPREDRVVDLDSGSTVLLYTDGLVERRNRDIDEGTEALVAALRDCAGLPLEELCDRVLERLFLPDAEDDVALLAVRLTSRY